MPLRSLAACSALALAWSACAPTPKQEPAPPAGPAAETALRTLARGDQSGLDGQRTFVARSTETWRELWKEHASPSLPAPEAPAVDFTRNMIAGIVLGPRPSAGYAVEIVRIERIGERLLLHAQTTEPPPDTMQATVMTNPFHFVALPRHDGSVELRVH
ncbi:MAG TPA: protease complex subunit PrcB family protein [Planctomycetota bacterium]|nr:protease complex subunit PrcB family protein [Planctomycetota bacterium]